MKKTYRSLSVLPLRLPRPALAEAGEEAGAGPQAVQAGVLLAGAPGLAGNIGGESGAKHGSGDQIQIKIVTGRIKICKNAHMYIDLSRKL